MSLISYFDREIATTTIEIDARAKQDARVEVLCQIRGIGRYTAMLVIAAVGVILPLPDGARALRLGGTDSDGAQLLWQGEARAHQPPRLAALALGARRVEPEERDRRRAAAREL